MDRKILNLIHGKFAGGPVGIETLSAALAEDKGTLEEVYEPFLIQEGLIQKTPRGRVITDLGKKHLATGTRMVGNCLTCFSCQEYCPQGIKVADIMLELRNSAHMRADTMKLENLTNKRDDK